ncbi:DNA-binding transcriptional regulator, LysR family [Actinacidiphila yanglinensis]|uniref:DNA-binding transcriptional regulator, LysR family n=1 Tax=Actinacidiphila yanglinensis TaxID=310779 RepID=A0A1H5XK84_9ACTN|nr:DNA-binding transcriptional regulator, LysR family [Actinacidiphila yanglinensis]
MRYFVTVAEELHFGRAADRLHIVQSAVSQQVRRLERELDVELFDRSPRHVRLTEAGTRFLPEARAVLAAEERARASVAEFADARARGLRLGTSTGLGVHLDRVLDAFADLAPGFTVDLVSASSAGRLEGVAAGELDAAFVRGDWPLPPAAQGSGPGGRALLPGAVDTDVDGVCVVPLWSDPLVAVVSARNPLARQADVAIEELAKVPLRLVPRRRNPPLVDLVVGACAAAGFEPVPGAAPADADGPGSLQDNLAAIGAGADLWTVVYASHAASLHAPRVAFLPFRGGGLALTSGLAVRRPPSRAAALLLDACARLDDLAS